MNWFAVAEIKMPRECRTSNNNVIPKDLGNTSDLVPYPISKAYLTVFLLIRQ